MGASEIRIQQLPDLLQVTGAVERGAAQIMIRMTSEDRRRVHRRLHAPDGETLLMELATGTVLGVGVALAVTQEKVYRVGAAPEDVLRVFPVSLDEAARVGHLIGNLHRDIQVANGCVTTLWNAPLEGRLKRLSLTYERGMFPFEGRPAGEHSH